MRKKYLSALLFGALLVTSAGTFTSCKDYDDEINNLQEQIDKVVADLESLKTTVENLGGVTDVKIEGGKLLVTAGGKTVEYTIPTGEAGDVEKTVVELDGQDLKVDGQVIGQVGDKVTVNEEGYLCVNGKATEIKAGKYAVLENDADGVVTITLPDANGELKTVELAKATSLAQLSNILYNEFESIEGEILGTFKNETDVNGGIHVTPDNFKHSIAWGAKSDKDLDWKGPKGKIVKDALLIGATPTAEISVLPASYNLGAQELTLVNTMGKEAPVKITAEAVENSPKTDGTRAIKNPGAWKLSMEMTSEVTKDNVDEIFTSNEKNVAYALAVNGTVISDYEFYVDTYAESKGIDISSGNNNGLKLTVSTSKAALAYFTHNATCEASNDANKIIKLGGETLLFSGTEAHKIYDAYIELTDIDMANRYGITVDGMTITASDKAANLSNFPFTIHIVDVKGQEFKENFNVKFGTTTADATDLEAQSYKLTPNTEYFIIDLGETFSSLTDEEADKVGRTGGDVAWTVDSKAKTLQSLGTVTYYASEADAKDKKNSVVMTSASTIKTAKYARVEFESGIYKNPGAEAGLNKVTLTLKDVNDNEIKKVNGELTFTLPTFDELFTKSAAWNGDVVTLNIDQNGDAIVDPAYKVVANSGADITKLVFTPSNTEEVTYSSNKLQVLQKAFNENTLKNVAISAASYTLFNNTELTVKSSAFTVDFRTPMEEAKFVNYVDGVDTPLEVKGTSMEFAGLELVENKKQGIAFSISGKDYVIARSAESTDKEFDIHLNDPASWPMYLDDAAYEVEFDTKAGDKAKAVFTSGKLSITDLAVPAGESYTTIMTVKITDVHVTSITKKNITVLEIPVVVKK